MSLKYYIPISILFFVVVVAFAQYYGMPVTPFALILLVGETMLGFQIEDEKVARRVSEFVRALRPTRTNDMRQSL